MKKSITQCARGLAGLSCDALLVSDPVNVAYLSGFSRADGYLLVGRDESLTYFTNFLYEAQAKQVKIWKVVARSDIFAGIKAEVRRRGFTKIGFEAKHLPFLEYQKIKEDCNAHAVDFVPTKDFIENIRAIKKPDEIAAIRAAIATSLKAFEFIREIHAGCQTEKDLSIEIERFLKLTGDNELAFAPIVAGGKNSAYPHYEPQSVALIHNFFLIDLGSKHCEYCADLTRVFFNGKITRLVRKIYDIVKIAQSAAIKKIRAGVTAKSVDIAARSIIEKKGYGKYFGHGLGHGVGRAVHEAPYLNNRNEQILKSGMVVTVEPGIYLEGKFGIRIEDMVLVGEHGCIVLSDRS
ncbi:MAG: aminopeptidase P family protein [Candidatus Omnitrophota bacterium]|nr:aminopeptidase P family protein [Candidatus Omnitrophota bacterium]